METGWHQPESKNLVGIPGVLRAEHIEERGIVGGLVKDAGTAVTIGQYLMGVTRAIAMRNARYSH